MTEYTGEIDISDIKRLYVEDIVLKRPCPICTSELTYDFSENYISYGSLSAIYFYCDECDEDYEVEARIVHARITLELDT